MDLFSLDRSKILAKRLRTFTLAISAFTVLGLTSCSESDDNSGNTVVENKPYQPIVHPVDFPPVVHPSDNPTSPEKVELGRRLFYEPRMSAHSVRSCGSCHEAKSGFALPASVRSDKRGAQSRQAMAVINVAYNKALLWD